MSSPTSDPALPPHPGPGPVLPLLPLSSGALKPSVSVAFPQGAPYDGDSVDGRHEGGGVAVPEHDPEEVALAGDRLTRILSGAGITKEDLKHNRRVSTTIKQAAPPSSSPTPQKQWHSAKTPSMNLCEMNKPKRQNSFSSRNPVLATPDKDKEKEKEKTKEKTRNFVVTTKAPSLSPAPSAAAAPVGVSASGAAVSTSPSASPTQSPATSPRTRTGRANAFTVPWIKFLSPSQGTVSAKGSEPDPELKVGTDVIAAWSKDEWLPAKIVMHSHTRKGVKYGVTFSEKNGTTLQLSRSKIKTLKEMRRASKVVESLAKIDPEQITTLTKKLSQEVAVLRTSLDASTDDLEKDIWANWDYDEDVDDPKTYRDSFGPDDFGSMTLTMTSTLSASARSSLTDEALLASPSPRTGKGTATPRIEEEEEPEDDDESQRPRATSRRRKESQRERGTGDGDVVLPVPVRAATPTDTPPSAPQPPPPPTSADADSSPKPTSESSEKKSALTRAFKRAPDTTDASSVRGTERRRSTIDSPRNAPYAMARATSPVPSVSATSLTTDALLTLDHVPKPPAPPLSTSDSAIPAGRPLSPPLAIAHASLSESDGSGDAGSPSASPSGKRTASDKSLLARFESRVNTGWRKSLPSQKRMRPRLASTRGPAASGVGSSEEEVQPEESTPHPTHEDLPKISHSRENSHGGNTTVISHNGQSGHDSPGAVKDGVKKGPSGQMLLTPTELAADLASLSLLTPTSPSSPPHSPRDAAPTPPGPTRRSLVKSSSTNSVHSPTATATTSPTTTILSALSVEGTRRSANKDRGLASASAQGSDALPHAASAPALPTAVPLTSHLVSGPQLTTVRKTSLIEALTRASLEKDIIDVPSPRPSEFLSARDSSAASAPPPSQSSSPSEPHPTLSQAQPQLQSQSQSQPQPPPQPQPQSPLQPQPQPPPRPRTLPEPQPPQPQNTPSLEPAPPKEISSPPTPSPTAPQSAAHISTTPTVSAAASDKSTPTPNPTPAPQAEPKPQPQPQPHAQLRLQDPVRAPSSVPAFHAPDTRRVEASEEESESEPPVECRLCHESFLRLALVQLPDVPGLFCSKCAVKIIARIKQKTRRITPSDATSATPKEPPSATVTPSKPPIVDANETPKLTTVVVATETLKPPTIQTSSVQKPTSSDSNATQTPTASITNAIPKGTAPSVSFTCQLCKSDFAMSELVQFLTLKLCPGCAPKVIERHRQKEAAAALANSAPAPREHWPGVTSIPVKSVSHSTPLPAASHAAPLASVSHSTPLPASHASPLAKSPPTLTSLSSSTPLPESSPRAMNSSPSLRLKCPTCEEPITLQQKEAGFDDIHRKCPWCGVPFRRVAAEYFDPSHRR